MILGHGRRNDLPTLRSKEVAVVVLVLEATGRPLLLDPGTTEETSEVF